MMMTHETRAARIATQLRTSVLGDWSKMPVPCVGVAYVHRVPVEHADRNGINEVWVRLGSASLSESTDEYRGTAEEVAKSLCLKLRAPSKAVQAAIDTIKVAYTKRNPGGRMGINDMRAPEVAAWLGLEEETTYRALDHMAEQGLVKDGGDTGWQDAP